MINEHVKYFLPFFFLLIGSTAFGQAKYYQSKKGDITDEKTYLKRRAAYEKHLKMTTDGGFAIIKETEIRTSSDSIVYAYTFKPNFGKGITRKWRDQEAKKEVIGKPFPFDKIEEASFKNVFESDKPTLINIWFTRCRPCIAEMPELNQLKEKYDGQINFISLALEDKEKVESFLQKTKFDFHHFTKKASLVKGLKIAVYPTNLFIDKDGIVKELTGSVSQTGGIEVFEQALKKLL